MMRILRRVLPAALVALGGLSACSDPAEPTENPSTLLGLQFTLSGATATVVGSALPTATAGFAAPVVVVDRPPTTTTSATMTVSAAEPFTAVLIQPQGSTSLVRVTLPGPTSLIGITVQYVTGGGVVATSGNVAVVNGTRTSASTPVSFLARIGN
jgi:hypothetical protein